MEREIDRRDLESWVENYIEVSFSRSSGAGGQNVNKLNTKVTAKLPLSKMELFTEEEKKRIRTNLKNRINTHEEIVIRVEEERKQVLNREIAVVRMIELVEKALEQKKKRIKTAPSKMSKERRVRLKKAISEKKRQRKKVDPNQA